MSALELKNRLQDTGGYDARVTVLGYIQRGGSPSSFDTVLASRMGAFAVESILEGKSGSMVCSICGQMPSAGGVGALWGKKWWGWGLGGKKKRKKKKKKEASQS
jgi:6-phosphofructokinase 1